MSNSFNSSSAFNFGALNLANSSNYNFAKPKYDVPKNEFTLSPNLVITAGGFAFHVEKERISQSSAVLKDAIGGKDTKELPLPENPQVVYDYLVYVYTQPRYLQHYTSDLATLRELTEFSFKYDVPATLKWCQAELIRTKSYPLVVLLNLAEQYRLTNLKTHVCSWLSIKETIETEEEKVLMACSKDTILQFIREQHRQLTAERAITTKLAELTANSNSSYLSRDDVTKILTGLDNAQVGNKRQRV